MSEDPRRWSQPFAALLGAYTAQIKLGMASIGGKDSMSGTFNDIDVPPTLVSFAVDVADEKDIITPELKKAGDSLYLFKVAHDEYDQPDYEQAMAVYTALRDKIQAKAVISAYVVEAYGLAAAMSKMAFGNKLGIKVESSLDARELFLPAIGDVVVEVPADKINELTANLPAGVSAVKVAEVTDAQAFIYGDMTISMEDAISAWTTPLEKVFPTRARDGKEKVESPLYKADSIYICKNKVARPKVFIPVFPGTNCEYDSAKVFQAAGAEANVIVFRNRNAEDIRESVDAFTKAVEDAQMIMFPGGFSGGDEPEGSAKFFATAFRNEKIKEAVNGLLQNRDGLVLGICNGFQAPIKLGLVPYGKITEQTADSPT